MIWEDLGPEGICSFKCVFQAAPDLYPPGLWPPLVHLPGLGEGPCLGLEPFFAEPVWAPKLHPISCDLPAHLEVKLLLQVRVISLAAPYRAAAAPRLPCWLGLQVQGPHLEEDRISGPAWLWIELTEHWTRTQ